MSQFLFLLVARYCCSSKGQERAHAKRLINMKSRERERKIKFFNIFFFVTNNALHRTGLHRFKGIFFKLKKKNFEMVNKFLSYRLFPP